MITNDYIEKLRTLGSVDAMRALAPLPKNAQEMIDKAVVRVGRQRLTLVNDLIASGLSVSMPNWLAVPNLTSHKLGEAGSAKRTMVPNARGERQIMQWTPYTLPLFCTWDDFAFDIRELSAAALNGTPLDTVHVEQAIRNCNESIEDAAINGGPTIGGNAVPGLMDSTNTFTYVSNEAWDNSGHTGGEIETDIHAGISVLQADGFYGPYNVYVPTSYGVKLEKRWSDGVTTFNTTIRQAIESMQFGGRGIGVRVADFLAANRVLIVQMTSDVVDVIVGQTPAIVPTMQISQFHQDFLALSCVVTRVKSNSAGNFGIAVGNTA